MDIASSHPIAFTSTLPLETSKHGDNDTLIHNFTATGRPFDPSKARKVSGMGAIGAGEGGVIGSPDYLPRRYTDDSTISIPVLPSSLATATSAHVSANLSTASTYSSGTLTTDENNPVKQDTGSGFKFWRSRKSSLSSQGPVGSAPATKKGKSQKPGTDFIMKNVTRGTYLKHYAKDEQGRYIGSEDPAADCILKHEADILKWRTSSTQWKNALQ